MNERHGHALITGASSGLGLAFAEALATRGYDLILTARSEAPMQTLKLQLTQTHGVEVLVEPLDLSAPGATAELVSRLDRRGIVPDVLVNNAGFGLSGRFVDHDPERLKSMLQLDIVGLTELTHALGKRMVARGHGRILLVASLTAHQPSPLMAAYAAAKAYVLSFGEALNVELAPNVGVTVLSPGLMNTGFNEASGFETSAAMQRTVMTTGDVARIGLDALFAGQSSIVAGRLNGAMAFAAKILPRRTSAKLAYRLVGGGS